MFTKPLTKTDYLELEKALEPFGFTQEKPGQFHHELLDCVFDFSACSIPGVINIIFNEAARMGGDAVRQEIRESLGIIE